MRHTYMYLMVNAFGLHKIGVTEDVNRRRLEVEKTSGVITRIVKHWYVGERKACYALEASHHRTFKEKRRCGEWFKLSVEDVGMFIKDMDSKFKEGGTWFLLNFICKTESCDEDAARKWNILWECYKGDYSKTTMRAT